MPEMDFNILTVVRALDEADDERERGPLLVEALLHPEACCLDRRESRARVTLRAALTHVIEKRLQAEALQTRGLGVTPEVKEVTVELQPPPRDEGGWSGPISIRFQVVERFKIERVDERDPAAFLAGVVAIFLTLRCANAAARFESEPGLHVVKDNAGEATCRVDAVTTPLDRYTPPDAVGTRGWIAPGVACRGYDLKNRVLHDSVNGDDPFSNIPLERAMLDAIEFAMNETVWAAVEGQGS